MTYVARRRFCSPFFRPLSLAILAPLAFTTPLQAQQREEEEGLTSSDKSKASTLQTLHVTAEQIAKQALGTSIITREDIERVPPANDLSEILRRMPGVNLTGNSASGAYGNNRQVDIRGMGPENTLVLVDGRQISSRDSVRMSIAGERNTRGDTNWVPAEAIERIEVLRGPAAARYGSGASGGVINIITKKPTGDLTGSVTLYGLVPQHGEEGGSQRAGFVLSGPLAREWSFRMYGNLNKTDADSPDINSKHSQSGTAAAGREGVRNKDINGLLRWDPTDSQTIEFEAGFSRQGNIFAGEYLNTASSAVSQLIGAETNVMIRRDSAITHRGRWDFGSSRLTFSYGDTDNTRLSEGLAGSTEGTISSSPSWTTSNLKNYMLDGDLNVPSVIGGTDNIWTFGFEYRNTRLNDPYSVTQAGTDISGLDAGDRSGKSDLKSAAAFIEDNIYVNERLTLTPGLRYDHSSKFGNNVGPSLNVQYKLSADWLLKGGIARAFKAPNLYQSNPNYLYYTRGRGCPEYYSGTGGCYIRGNADLKPETSINKEIGVEWAPDNGWHASLTFFDNDYKNKVVAGYSDFYQTSSSAYVYQWVNASKALVRGMEGNFKVPLAGLHGGLLSWNTNLTWMIENKNKATNQPLSVTPKYTLNTSLDWQASEKLMFSLIGSVYGKQKQASRNNNNDPICGTEELGACDSVGSYALWGLSGRYRITPKVSFGVGVNNLGDKRLFREGSRATAAGAATYNEPGRSYWATMNFGF